MSTRANQIIAALHARQRDAVAVILGHFDEKEFLIGGAPITAVADIPFKRCGSNSSFIVSIAGDGLPILEAV